MRNLHARTTTDKKKALDDAIQWLLLAQQRTPDGGMGSYHLVEGWTSSYPETTGYIIPALLNYGGEKPVKAALEAADWLTTIQKPSGGWQSMRIADNRPEVVFNTGQVIRGMVAAYQHSGEQKYLEAATRACDWLVSIQNEDGSWSKHVYMGVARVYDSYVSAPMLQVYTITGNDSYRNAAIKNLDWIIETQQQKNGWFANCDNTVKHNDRPILHTIAYTADGLLECGTLLNEPKYILAGTKVADVLLHKFEATGILNGRWDKDWNGTEAMICTGSAQIAICWLKLFEQTGESRYLNGAAKMNDLLCYIQQDDRNDGRGALQGSFPLWGRYEKFAYPNWATKYLADALLEEQKLSSHE